MFKSLRSVVSIASQRSFGVSAMRSYASKSIFVGNLPFGIDQEGLKSHFEAHCQVVGARLPLDHLGRSRGFGFVEVEEADFDRVISELNNSELNGRQIRLDAAASNNRF